MRFSKDYCTSENAHFSDLILRMRESFTGGEVRWATDFARVAEEALAPRLGFGSLELVPNNPADRQTGPPAPFLEPLGEVRCKTDGNGLTHRVKT